MYYASEQTCTDLSYAMCINVALAAVFESHEVQDMI